MPDGNSRGRNNNNLKLPDIGKTVTQMQSSMNLNEQQQRS
jgi:hypothetical protein